MLKKLREYRRMRRKGKMEVERGKCMEGRWKGKRSCRSIDELCGRACKASKRDTEHKEIFSDRMLKSISSSDAYKKSRPAPHNKSEQKRGEHRK
jgi:hypothetical protein